MYTYGLYAFLPPPHPGRIQLVIQQYTDISQFLEPCQITLNSRGALTVELVSYKRDNEC
jgi:hypothetical protein